MKRAVILTMFMVLGLLTACAGQRAPAAGGGGAAGAAQLAEPIQVEFWHYYTPASTTGLLLDELIPEFNARPESRVYVTAQFLPREDLLRRYALGVVSGELPEIGMVDNPDSASFSAMGLWMDVTDRVDALPINNWIQGAIDSGRFNGRQHTIPMNSNCLALWSNDEMLAAAGIDTLPETWDELMDVSARLLTANPDVHPFGFSAIRTEEGTFQFLPFLLSTGESWDTMDSPGAIRSLQLIRDLLDNGFISPEVINWTQADVEMQFSAGNLAMMVNGTWQIPNVAMNAPYLAYTISNIPRDQVFATSLGGENIGMTTAAVGIEDEVWDFIEWFMSDETLLLFNQIRGTLAPNLDITVEMQHGNDPVWLGFQQQIVYARARGPHPNWPELSTAIQEAMQSVLIGASTPEQAGIDAAAIIAEINARD